MPQIRLLIDGGALVLSAALDNPIAVKLVDIGFSAVDGLTVVISEKYHDDPKVELWAKTWDNFNMLFAGALITKAGLNYALNPALLTDNLRSLVPKQLKAVIENSRRLWAQTYANAAISGGQYLAKTLAKTMVEAEFIQNCSKELSPIVSLEQGDQLMLKLGDAPPTRLAEVGINEADGAITYQKMNWFNAAKNKIKNVLAEYPKAAFVDEGGKLVSGKLKVVVGDDGLVYVIKEATNSATDILTLQELIPANLHSTPIVFKGEATLAFNTNDGIKDVLCHSENGKLYAIIEGIKISNKEITYDDLIDLINNGDEPVRIVACIEDGLALKLAKKVDQPFYSSHGWVDINIKGEVASENPFYKFAGGEKTEESLAHVTAVEGEVVRLGDGQKIDLFELIDENDNLGGTLTDEEADYGDEFKIETKIRPKGGGKEGDYTNIYKRQ